MNELQQQSWSRLNATREERLKDLRGDKSLEERLAQLEESVMTEDDRLYAIVLPEYDDSINRSITQSENTDLKADERYQQSVREVNKVKSELEKSIQETLAKTVNDLIASSSADVVVTALREALKSTVLITRQANRNELATALVTRLATPAEARKKD
jgi:hypothetical protein